jgi:hypothetical protein
LWPIHAFKIAAQPMHRSDLWWALIVSVKSIYSIELRFVAMFSANQLLVDMPQVLAWYLIELILLRLIPSQNFLSASIASSNNNFVRFAGSSRCSF